MAQGGNKSPTSGRWFYFFLSLVVCWVHIPLLTRAGGKQKILSFALFGFLPGDLGVVMLLVLGVLTPTSSQGFLDTHHEKSKNCCSFFWLSEMFSFCDQIVFFSFQFLYKLPKGDRDDCGRGLGSSKTLRGGALLRLCSALRESKDLRRRVTGGVGLVRKVAEVPGACALGFRCF